MTETVNAPPLPFEQMPDRTGKNGGFPKTALNPLELFQQYSVERGNLAAKANGRNLRITQEARLHDLNTRLIPNVVRRMNS